MATVIRLKRGGRTHTPYYRVVVMDSRTRARGREIDTIGYYQPCERPVSVVEVNVEKALAWLGKGAQTSDTVRDIFTKKGILAAYNQGKAAGEAVSPAEETAAE